jgi:hypothetical protein
MGLFDFLKRKNRLTSKQRQELLAEVEVVPGLFLPKVLADHWPAIEKNRLDSVRITLTPQNELTLT